MKRLDHQSELVMPKGKVVGVMTGRRNEVAVIDCTYNEINVRTYSSHN